MGFFWEEFLVCMGLPLLTHLPLFLKTCEVKILLIFCGCIGFELLTDAGSWFYLIWLTSMTLKPHRVLACAVKTSRALLLHSVQTLPSDHSGAMRLSQIWELLHNFTLWDWHKPCSSEGRSWGYCLFPTYWESRKLSVTRIWKLSKCYKPQYARRNAAKSCVALL